MDQINTLLMPILDMSEAEVIRIREELTLQGYLNGNKVLKSRKHSLESEYLEAIAKTLGQKHQRGDHFLWYSAEYYDLAGKSKGVSKEKRLLLKIREYRQRLEYIREQYYSWTKITEPITGGESSLDFLQKMIGFFDSQSYWDIAKSEFSDNLYRFGQDLFGFLIRLALEEQCHWAMPEDEGFFHELLQKIFKKSEPLIELKEPTKGKVAGSFYALQLLAKASKINENLESHKVKPLFSQEFFAYFSAEIAARNDKGTSWVDSFLQFDFRRLYQEEGEILLNIPLLIRINLLQGKLAMERKNYRQALESLMLNVAIYLDSIIRQQTDFLSSQLNFLLKEDSVPQKKTATEKLLALVEQVKEEGLQKKMKDLLPSAYSSNQSSCESKEEYQKNIDMTLTLNEALIKQIARLNLLTSDEMDSFHPESRKGWLNLTGKAGTVGSQHTIIEELQEAFTLIAPQIDPKKTYFENELNSLSTRFFNWRKQFCGAKPRVAQLNAALLTFRENMNSRIGEFEDVDYGNIGIYVYLTEIALCQLAMEARQAKELDEPSRLFLEVVWENMDILLRVVEEETSQERGVVCMLASYYRIVHQKISGKIPQVSEDFLRKLEDMKKFYPSLYHKMKNDLTNGESV